jgi:hypothetical protein
MKEFIVKVQWPISTNEPQPLVLVYNRDRSIHQKFPATTELRERMNNRPKVYFWAVVNQLNGKLELGRNAPDQNW